MEINQKEKDGIVCIAIKGRMDSGLVLELEGAIKKIIADSVESGIQTLQTTLNAAQYQL